jgi:hypothetical protein
MRLMLNLETPGAGILVSMQSWPRGVSETEQFRKVSAGGIMAIAICRLRFVVAFSAISR